LQVTDDHFAAALQNPVQPALQNPVQQAAAIERNEAQELDKGPESLATCASMRSNAVNCGLSEEHQEVLGRSASLTIAYGRWTV